MKLYKWRKKPGTGAHVFKFKQRIRTVPGDVTICPIDALGSFYEEYDCVAEVVDGKEQPISEDPVLAHVAQEREALREPAGLELKHAGFGRWYVINPENPDKPLNDKAMSKELAERFIEYLNEDDE